MKLEEFFLLEEKEINCIANLVYFSTEFEEKFKFSSDVFLHDNENLKITSYFDFIFNIYIEECLYKFVNKLAETEKKVEKKLILKKNLENIIFTNKKIIIYFCLVVKEFNHLFSVKLSEAQIASSLHMFSGSFVELMTGSGKTFAISLTVIWYVKLEKKKVHVATFTSYLSSRDLAELKPFYNFLSIYSSEIKEKKYEESDVIYGDISSYTFSYLSYIDIKKASDIAADHLKVIILDESDGILVEKDLVKHILGTDANIIDAKNTEQKNKLFQINNYNLYIFLQKIKHSFINGMDYITLASHHSESKNFHKITFRGRKKLNKIMEDDKFYFLKSRPSLTYFLTLSILRALSKKVKIDYVIDNNTKSIIPIDPYSGEKNNFSRFTDMEHEILEIENNLLDIEDKKMFFSKAKFSSSMNIYTYLRFYDSCIGISGTNLEIKDMIKSLFNKETVGIVQNFTNQKKDIYLHVFSSYKDKTEYLKEQIKLYFPRPMLVLTDNAKNNRSLYRFLNENIEFLNKKNLIVLDVLNEHVKSMIIDRKAGKEGFVIVSTNIISRGVDIKITHKLQKEFICFKSWYREKQIYILDSSDSHKCYIFEKIIEVFNKELEDFKFRNKGLIIFLFQPYLDRRLDKQAIGRTARMGKDGVIHKLFSFDDKITWVKKEKSSPFSILNLFFPILEKIKKSYYLKRIFSKFNLDKIIFLFVRRIQNIEYIFSSGPSEEEKLKDLLINGFVKKKFFLIHVDKESLKNFLKQMEILNNRLNSFEKNIVLNNIENNFKEKFKLHSVKNVLYFIKKFALKKESFFSKEFSTQEFLVKSGFLGNWKIITGLIDIIRTKSDNLNSNYIGEYFLFTYSIILNSLIEKILLVRKNHSIIN